MATRSLWRTRGKLAVAATVASSEDPETSLKLCTAVPVRLYLDTVTAQTPSIAFDNEGVNAENKFLRMIKRVRFSRKSLKRHLVATIDKFIVHVARTHDGQKLSVRMGWLMKLVKVCPGQVESTSGWASWWGWWAVQVAVATIAFH